MSNNMDLFKEIIHIMKYYALILVVEVYCFINNRIIWYSYVLTFFQLNDKKVHTRKRLKAYLQSKMLIVVSSD